MPDQRKLGKAEFVQRVLADQKARHRRAAIIWAEYTNASITRNLRRKYKHRRR